MSFVFFNKFRDVENTVEEQSRKSLTTSWGILQIFLWDIISVVSEIYEC